MAAAMEKGLASTVALKAEVVSLETVLMARVVAETAALAALTRM